MSSLNLILLCSLASWAMFLWFYTDFFAYYLKALKPIFPKKVYSWLLIDEFFNDTESNADTYIGFFTMKRYGSVNFGVDFVLKLFGCIICLSTWMSIIISLILGNILYVGAVFALLRVIDFILRYANN